MQIDRGGLIGNWRKLALAVLGLAAAMPAMSAETQSQARMALGREVFTSLAVPQCGICHALRDAGTTGEIGARLEELKPDVNRVVMAVRKGLGVMPPYAGKLTEEQIQAVAHYVARASQQPE